MTPLVSILIPARNNPALTADCLRTTLDSMRRLLPESAVEYVLMDDASDPRDRLAEMMLAHRAATAGGSRVRVLRFEKHQHYTGVFAHGLSLATGHNVLFVSNDMAVTPAFVRTLLAVAALDPTIGIVRGRSQHTDSHPEYRTPTPFALRRYEDVRDFSAYVARYAGLAHADDRLLSGDAVLVRRAVIGAIGVMDTQFFGYFGDPDYGLRARRAGFRLVCAMGAWLHHSGAGHVVTEAQTGGEVFEAAQARRMALVAAAYVRFREKWDTSLPLTGEISIQTIDFDRLVVQGRGGQYVAPLALDPAIVREL